MVRGLLDKAAAFSAPWRQVGMAQHLLDALQEGKPILFSQRLMWLWEEAEWIIKAALAEQFGHPSPPQL